MLDLGQWRDPDEPWRERLSRMPHEVGPIGLVSRGILLALWTLGFLRHGMKPRR